MKTVILCGGYGTRIRGVADDIPKPMIPIGGLPILWHIMKGYAQAGFADFVLCLGYRGDVIKSGFSGPESYADPNWRVEQVKTGLRAMTGARIKRIAEYLGADQEFFLTYGDGLCDVDLRALLAFHRSHGKLLTVTGVRPPARFGEIEYNAGLQVTEFNEKSQATAGRISGGFFVANREILDYLSDADDCILEADPMRTMVRDRRVMVRPHDGFWQCMDTPREYELLNSLWDSGKAPWKTW